MINEVIKDFRNRFQKEPDHIFFCPGRVNLIGEHIDYNGGQVMPCAITPGNYLAVSKNLDKRFRFHCLNFPEMAELHLQESYSRTGKQWYNYPLGIINQILHEGYNLSGLDMLFYGNLPVGAGLSSSASIELLTAFSINELFGLGISRKDLALLSKKVENEFIGVNCGIMDQFAVALGQKNNAMLLNCDTLDFEYIRFKLGSYILAVINSNKQRTLADSKYNERFAECGGALKALKKELEITSLCELGIATFDKYRHLINDSALEKRALHVVCENARVKDAAIALQAGDMEMFGKLMYASHQSLKELYEVTGKELDCIVDFCKIFSGCIGARMTGAGFGGCAIALVKENKFDEFSEKLAVHYKKTIGYSPDIFFTTAENGVRQIKP